MKIRSRWLNAIAGTALAHATRTWGATLRFRSDIQDPRWDPLAPDCPQFYLVATWHDTMLLPIMLRRTIRQRTPNNRMTTLVSKHQDGSFLTYAMKGFDLETVRGSTNRGGTEALRSLMRLAQSRHICITPDGPRGPRRTASAGIVFLAAQTGLPILPCLFNVNRGWRWQGSWTDLVIPKPGATVYGIYGPPMSVPAQATRDEIASYRQQLQSQMDRVQADVDQWAATGIASANGSPAPVREMGRAA